MQTENIRLSLNITVGYTYCPYDKNIELDSVIFDKYPELGDVLPLLTDEDHDNIIRAVDRLGKEWGQP